MELKSPISVPAYHVVSRGVVGGPRILYPELGTGNSTSRNYRTAAQHTPLLTNRPVRGMLAKRRR